MVNTVMVARLLSVSSFLGQLGNIINSGSLQTKIISWPSIIIRPILYIDCQNQMYMYPGSVTIRSTCISRGCRIGSRIYLKWVQILQRMARLVT